MVVISRPRVPLDNEFHAHAVRAYLKEQHSRARARTSRKDQQLKRRCLKLGVFFSMGLTGAQKIMMTIQEQLIAQLDNVLGEFSTLRKRSNYDDISDMPEAEVIQFVTRARAAVERIAGRPSPYIAQCDEVFEQRSYSGHKARALAGILASLRADIAAGYTHSQRELLHAEMFADFIEMAQHLLAEGYKDAAAVIAGSSLEAHLRQLCAKHGISCTVESGGSAIAKKADRLNAELATAVAYSKLDQKNVTAWLDLRNKAAHGHYSEYDAAQVRLLVSAVQDFIARNPA